MKTKYDTGETVLVPCKVDKIIISQNKIGYKVIPEAYEKLSLDLLEDEIHSSMCKEEVKGCEPDEQSI